MEIKGEKVKITKMICPNWKEMGDLMDFDDRASQVSIIDMQTSNLEDCLIEVLRLWLQGESRAYKPASWRTFIELLNDCNHGTLSAKLEEHFH